MVPGPSGQTINPVVPSALGQTVYTHDPKRPSTRSTRAKRKGGSTAEPPTPSTPTGLGSPKRPRRA